MTTTNSSRNLLQLLPQPYVDDMSPREHRVAAGEDRILGAAITEQLEEWDPASSPGLHTAVLFLRRFADGLAARAEKYDAAADQEEVRRTAGPTPRPRTTRTPGSGQGCGRTADTLASSQAGAAVSRDREGAG
ncbi:hypothetical protein BS329_15440 [Amycolatopsis coloradensis]|uniref:Uncharacterized protein n=1 Tax=Amycolatopsis coloradensis TaxID=76021 RepID=A0A1R0KU53_9PSEU|nr:hypothetical protein [Amycolatopsis coloradensis]OLZ51658.1 hypothetical protein BS329_15440 [Amycolatopsis coloradensis]